MSAEALGQFFDEHAPREMLDAEIAGAAIVVVSEGQVRFARGYGHADVALKTPVSPSATLFRIASISKVVTYTAVMQLVAQGKIDLDADVTRYLDFPIPATYAAPITVRHLMAHTSGFADTVEGRWVRTGKPLATRDYLIRQMPKRIFAPGAVPGYSSYGPTLAGYIVERVSGEPFESYVERHIFRPLGMSHSSFAQPLPPQLAPLLSQAYDTATGPARPFDTAQIGPATSMSSSAIDMARFMLASLGEPGPADTLLQPATLAQMHTVQFRHHPAGPGIALGLYEMDVAAQRLIGHTGDIPGFHSGLYLWPGQRTGLLILQNTEAGDAMRNRLVKAFAAQFLPPVKRAVTVRGHAATDQSAQVQGSYLSSDRFESSPLFLSAVLRQSLVRVVGPGQLAVDGQVGSVEWQAGDSAIWRNSANPLRLRYFRKDADGRWEMSNSVDPVRIMQQAPWYLHPQLVGYVLLASIAVVLLSLLAWPMSAILRSRGGTRAVLSPELQKADNTLRLVGLLTLSPWLLYAGIGIVVMQDLLFISSPICAWLLRAVQVLSWLAVAGTVAALWAASVGWRAHDASLMSRSRHALITLACTGAAAVAWQGGLLIWNGRY